MSNRIREVLVRDHQLEPTCAEIWITVVPDFQAVTTRIGGRLMGPRCHYSSTVEVAYYLQPLPHPVVNAPGLTMRVVIPEPSFWEPQTPFLYHGFVNLLQDQSWNAQYLIQHGLRSLDLRPRGLRLNGRPFRIEGAFRSELSEQDAGTLRQKGVNTLFTPVSSASASLWEDADRLGFFVIGEVTTEASSLPQALALLAHPCCLAWLLPPEWAQQDLLPETDLARLAIGRDTLLGVRIHQGPPQPLPTWVSFIACPRSALPALTSVLQPKLVLLQEGELADEDPLTAAGPLAPLGWIAP